jgi:uncharacterized protein (DUF1778 family)
MPTTKPRITITLTDHQHELLQQLAGYQGASMSSIVVDLLETAVPVMERIATVMKAASTAPQEMLHGLRESMERAESLVVSQMQEHIGQLDIFVQEAAAAGETDVTRSGAPGSPAAAASSQVRKKPRPPTSNRGVRITENSPIPPMKKSISTAKRSGVRK